MAPHLKVISGGKLALAENSEVTANKVVAELERTIALYVESMLIQLEAISRLVQFDELAHSLGLMREEARELVRRLNQPA